MSTRQAKPALKTFLTSIVQSVDARDRPGQFDEPALLFMQNGVSVGLSAAEAKGYYECVDLLKPSPSKGGRPSPISVHAIQAVVNDAIIKALNERSSETPVAKLVQGLVDEIDTRLQQPPRQFSLRTPVEGVTLARHRVRVGAVTLQTRDRVLRERRVFGEVKRWFRDHATRRGDVWASITVRAVDRRAALAVARYRVQLVLDLVNLYAGQLRAPFGAAAYLPGVRARRDVAVFIDDHQRSGPIVHRAFEGPLAVPVAPLHRARAYRALSRLIAADVPLTAVEERVLSALRWFGRGATAPWDEEGFMNFIIALESLLLGPDREGELTYRLRLRSAFLLATKGERRKVIFDQIGRLYKVRSQIVHRGSLRVDPNERIRARNYAMAAILTIAADSAFMKLPSVEAVEQWFEHRILNVRSAPTKDSRVV